MLSIVNPSTACVICYFAAIRFRSFLPVFEHLPFPIMGNNMLAIIFVTLLPPIAVSEASDKLHRHIVNEVNVKSGKLVRKRLAALHAFGVKIGPIRDLRKITIIMCYDLIANYIVSFLITYPQEEVTR